MPSSALEALLGTPDLNLLPNFGRILHITCQTEQLAETSGNPHSLVGQARGAAVHPKLAAVPVALLLAAGMLHPDFDSHLLETAVMVQSWVDCLEQPEHKFESGQVEGMAAVDCAKGLVRARVLEHVQ